MAFTASAADGDFAYRVKCESGNTVAHGTACAISAHTLVTAAHVVAGADEIFIDHEIGWLRCKVLKFDAQTDLAVIECKSVELKFISIDTAKQIPGESITIWASIAGAKIKAIAASVRSLFDEHRWLASAQGFDHGGSGSPVVHDNKLIGVATALDSERTKQPIIVMADCIQHVMAPETFAGEKLPPPTRAEIVTPLTSKQSLRVPVIRQFQTTAAAPVCRGEPCRREQTPMSRARHWDSDIDGHGQGGWVNE